ncbi:MAG: serine/threonine protein kinase [Ignavibacterium sp.]|nr:serine/threonine protein kinase [Ignavibacterium sp.]
MNLEKLNKVRELFDEASRLSTDERELYLNQKCANDLELKKEILSLFDSLGNTKDFLEEPLTIVEQNKSGFTDPYIGKQIGNYLIEGEAGIGGMGLVYSGKRNDKEFEHKVAIKILKHGITSEYLLKRFQIERQTLANLQHKNIARLLDGGRTADGLPFLVMEFIDGTPITEFCNKEKLSIQARLKIFRKVCEAVQYAHQNLVIHRDLKPGNILVTKDGAPKLLDFGIVKLIDEDLVDATEGLTRTGVWHLTPEYASPEQIKGEKITTASDVYSLGVLLYQILTGLQPYKITNSSPAAISKIITEEKIQKPSEKVKDKSETHTESKLFLNDKISNQLKGDLDNIVSKAMHKDPARRYVSVEQFSDDIRRHLSGLPVIAQKDTAGYRLSKFIQRHKVGFVSSIGFIVFLIASMIAILWQANVAASERDNAKIEAQKVETVNKFLQDMLSSVDPTEIGRDVKVYDVLKKASDDVENDFTNHPEIEAAVRKTIGKTLTNLGEFDEAEPHLIESLELNNKVYGNKSYQSAESMHELALYYHWIGEFNLADSLYAKSILIFRQNEDSPPRALASTLNDFGILKQDQASYKESLKLLKESYNIFLKYNGEKDRDVASTLNNLALTLESLNDIDGAEKYYQKSLEVYLELYGPNRPEISTLYNNLAYIYIDKEDLNKAEEYFRKSLELKIKTLGNNHSLVGLAYMNLGALEYTMKKFETSESNLLKALNNFNTSLNSNHVWLGLTDFWYGKILIEKSQYKAAEKYIRTALSIYKKNYPKDHPNEISANAELGIALFYQKKYTEAEKLLLNGYESIKVIKGEKNHNTIRFLEYLVKLYEKSKNSDKLAYYNQLLLQAKK